ncbi:YceI family protein [Pseudoflavitalea sp. G-6-1-2]|uniref:YceI family protein n=1 Tax=Pseudoflavitalea sp. G-6-1-2 TaxID=2728841 RepID=UPI00146DBD4E|nr:YceI family protein [Pseudoflavitalea sp. G-6-1-2]NML20692.1 YceI family protein [Pseudoflavitalea sp. G-6-1-2]
MATWTIDGAHSQVSFKVKHLVISTVTGKFKTFEGTVESEKDDFTDASIQFSADVNSVDTNNEGRDGHLKSPEFFDAAKYPLLSFVSSSMEKKSGDEYVLKGNLTIKGTTKPIVLDVEFGGVQKNMYGNTVAGFELSGKINRQDFGLTWSAVTETGGLVVSDEVKLHINVELIKK